MGNDVFKAIPAVYLILRKGNEVLLLKRANTGYMDGWYSLPAGHHDGGQTLREGAAREAKEEIGITVNPEDMTFAHFMQRQAKDGERLDTYFTAEKYTGEIINAEPDKCSELAWFTLDTLPENVVPVVRQALFSFRDGVAYSEAKE
jgi:8-oxo-dGTP diphosphatase